MSDYQLKGIDPELWRKVRIICADKGISLKVFLLKAIDHYLSFIKEHSK